ncbi:MAG: hypothetical protein ACPHWZ_01135 [Longimicrobiales bacterium]
MALLPALVLAGCYTPPDSPPAIRSGALEETALVFQAVDAGTGGPLSDSEMTVRYLVREPIIFDASNVERVSSREAYEISHAVGDPSLVLEVRVEADSYHRLDTVLSVGRGQSVGPLTVRLSRRLDRVATTSTPAATRPADPGPARVDYSAMNAGNRAFQQQAWLEATEAYQGMPAPDDDMSEYGRAYLEAKVRQGTAHISRSEFGRALEIFEEVVEMEEPGADAFLRLAQAQCAVGRVEEGRGTLASLGRARNRMTPEEQSNVSAMIAYQRGVCTQSEFDRAQTTRERVRYGAQATQELNAFIEGARAMSPVPPEVYNAVRDAERRVADIQRRIAGGR